MKKFLLLVVAALLTNIMNAQEIDYSMTYNIQGSTDVFDVTELNDNDLNTYKRIAGVNSTLTINTDMNTELTSYSLVAANESDVLFQSGMSENATGTESISIGSGINGNSVIIGGNKNTLVASLTGKACYLNDLTFASLIKLPSGTTGEIDFLSIETSASEHVTFAYNITNQQLVCNYKGSAKQQDGVNIPADTKQQLGITINTSNIKVFIDQVAVASWTIGTGIPADEIGIVYLGYNSQNSTSGSLIEFDEVYFYNYFESKPLKNLAKIHDYTKVWNKLSVAGSDFEFGPQNWSLYGVNADLTAVLIDEQTNQFFTNGEQKDFVIAPGKQFNQYQLKFKGFALSEFKVFGDTPTAIGAISEDDITIKQDYDRITISCNEHFTYKVYDLTGNLVEAQSKKILSSTVQLAKHKVYVLKIQVGNQVVGRKVIL
ncbi:hypothetical protein E9993_06190 [Labilibacter sediminis]|nr:hypothetical protein E9993_06190 [Labilibacter sediminis]